MEDMISRFVLWFLRLREGYCRAVKWRVSLEAHLGMVGRFFAKSVVLVWNGKKGLRVVCGKRRRKYFVMRAISEHTECCRVSRGSQAANNHPLEQTLQTIQLTAPSVTVHSVRGQKSREIATIYVVDVGSGNMLEYARDCVEDCVDLFMLSSFSQRSGSPLIRVLAQTR
jgi:hypothetical protein